MYEFAGIGLIPDSVREGNILIDERWKQFTELSQGSCVVLTTAEELGHTKIIQTF